MDHPFLWAYLLLAGCIFWPDFDQPSQMKSRKVEIYLVGNAQQTRGETQFFQPESLTSSDLLFLSDSDIISYEMVGDTSDQNRTDLQYFLHLSEPGQEKLAHLDSVELCCGRRFIITVDRRPIFGGYFWNLFSSFSCDWIVAVWDQSSKRLVLERGYPSSQFAKGHADRRSDHYLLAAFQETGRLVRKIE
jgi:hypothetical protein